MASALVLEIWDADADKFKAHASFASFDQFYSEILRLLAGNAGRLRCFIPGSYRLSPAEQVQLEQLNIERI